VTGRGRVIKPGYILLYRKKRVKLQCSTAVVVMRIVVIYGVDGEIGRVCRDLRVSQDSGSAPDPAMMMQTNVMY
jgi:hypothetical protein